MKTLGPATFKVLYVFNPSYCLFGNYSVSRLNGLLGEKSFIPVLL